MEEYINNPFRKPNSYGKLPSDWISGRSKKMNNTTVNASLMSLIGLFGAGAVTEFVPHFWYAVVCFVVVVGCAVAYDLLNK